MMHAYPDARRHFDRRIAEALDQLAEDPRNLEAQRRLALAKRDLAQLVAAIERRNADAPFAPNPAGIRGSGSPPRPLRHSSASKGTISNYNFLVREYPPAPLPRGALEAA